MALVVSLVLAAAGAFSLFLLWLALDRALSQRRLAARLARYELLDAPAAPAGERPRLVHLAALRRLGAAAAACWPQELLLRWRRTLLHAGLVERLSVEEFLALRLVATAAGVLLGACVVVWLGPAGLAVSVLGGVVGYLAPAVVVARVSRKRRRAIERLLPVTIDMIVVSIRAGLSFDSALLFVCERVDNELVRELRRCVADMQLGSSRRDALLALADRTQSATVNQFVRAVIQAEELGNGMARTLSGQSAALREIRRLTAEEQAGKATIKLMFPLAAFMMPALFILIMGPAVLQTLQMFRGR